MMLVEKILMEAKQVGVVYHYTSTDGLYKILKTNKLIPRYYKTLSKYYGDGYLVSTTRDKNFHTNNRETIGGVSCRIELDGDMISNNYKILPFNFYNAHRKLDITRPDESESEEIILTGQQGLINVKKFIIKITLLPSYKNSDEEMTSMEKISDMLEQENISYSIY